MTTLLDMLNASEVREEDESFKNAADLMFDQLEHRDPDHFAVRQYRKYKMAAGVRHQNLKGKSIYYLCDLYSSQPSKGV